MAAARQGGVRLLAGAALAVCSGAAVAVPVIIQPSGSPLYGTDVLVEWGNDNGVPCENGTLKVLQRESPRTVYFEELKAKGGPTLVESVTGLPDDGQEIRMEITCEGYAVARYNFFAFDAGGTPPPDPDPGPDEPGDGTGDPGGTEGGGTGASEIVVTGEVTLAPGTVITLDPNASVALSSGMTAEELSLVGTGVALTMVAGFGARSVRRALGTNG